MCWEKYTWVTICSCLQIEKVITKCYQVLNYIILKVWMELAAWISIQCLTLHVSIHSVVGEKFFRFSPPYVFFFLCTWSWVQSLLACRTVVFILSTLGFLICYVPPAVLASRHLVNKNLAFFLQSEKETETGQDLLWSSSPLPSPARSATASSQQASQDHSELGFEYF